MEGYNLTCSNCNKETRGIKLNGKIFCTYCGEIIKDSVEILEEAYEHTPPEPIESTKKEAKRITKIGEVIRPSESIDLLTAEEEILEVIEKNSKSQKKEAPTVNNKTIKKINRNRVGMMVLDNEPDPVEKLELEAPHEDQIESPGLDAEIKTTDKEVNYPFHDNKSKRETEEKTEEEQAPLTAPQKESTNKTSKPKPKKNTKKKKKKHKKSHKWLYVTISLTTLITLIFIGLVYYVNNYATDQEYIKQNIESNPTFSYTKPIYITPGYEVSYLSNSDEGYINYRYEYITENEYIVFRAEETSLEPGNIYEELIRPEGSAYKTKKINGVDVWEVNSRKIYFIKGDVLYTITSSANILAELEKIAEGVIN